MRMAHSPCSLRSHRWHKFQAIGVASSTVVSYAQGKWVVVRTREIAFFQNKVASAYDDRRVSSMLPPAVFSTARDRILVVIPRRTSSMRAW